MLILNNNDRSNLLNRLIGPIMTTFLLLSNISRGVETDKIPPPISACASEPVRYVGKEQSDKRFYDGAIRHAIGVHNYQAMRANRTCPPEGGMLGWTYNHQPYLAYWRDRFYLQYLSTPKEEHVPPGRTLLMISKDGQHWSNPKVVFPEYSLPEIKTTDGHLPAGTPAVMHQRMGFYTAPNGRLLTLAFYSYCFYPLYGPNRGQGLGRVVREIRPDNNFGPIYFIRYNRQVGWNETNTSYPFYRTSTDAGFVEACDALLKDELMTLQWWEEDRATDGFFTIKPEDGTQPKAFCFVHRPDGTVLGVWKHTMTALSPDDGKSWTTFAKSPTLMTCSAKVWVQRTEDDRYALVYNHSATRMNRFPMVIMTSEDCRDFDNILCLHGEVPPKRFSGILKNLGPQYIRGIVEGNGNPPGSHLWNTYSVNKEDIWISRTRVPIIGTVTQHVQQNFDNVASSEELEWWNLYQPQLAPIDIVEDPHQSLNKCLELRDEDPYDYALAERAFPESSRVRIEFRILAALVGHGVLEAEVQDRYGRRPIKVRLDSKWLAQDQMTRWVQAIPVVGSEWLTVQFDVDCADGTYNLSLNGKAAGIGIKFAQKTETVERIVFRTGPWRGDVRAIFVNGEHATLGYTHEDLPGADQRVPLSVYMIDDVRTTTE